MWNIIFPLHSKSQYCNGKKTEQKSINNVRKPFSLQSFFYELVSTKITTQPTYWQRKIDDNDSYQLWTFIALVEYEQAFNSRFALGLFTAFKWNVMNIFMAELVKNWFYLSIRYIEIRLENITQKNQPFKHQSQLE